MWGIKYFQKQYKYCHVIAKFEDRKMHFTNLCFYYDYAGVFSITKLQYKSNSGVNGKYKTIGKIIGING